MWGGMSWVLGLGSGGGERGGMRRDSAEVLDAPEARCEGCRRMRLGLETGGGRTLKTKSHCDEGVSRRCDELRWTS